MSFFLATAFWFCCININLFRIFNLKTYSFSSEFRERNVQCIKLSCDHLCLITIYLNNHLHLQFINFSHSYMLYILINLFSLLNNYQNTTWHLCVCAFFKSCLCTCCLWFIIRWPEHCIVDKILLDQAQMCLKFICCIVDFCCCFVVSVFKPKLKIIFYILSTLSIGSLSLLLSWEESYNCY